MLLKFQFIKKIKVGNYSLFLPLDMSEDIGKLNFFMKNDLNKKIIELFKQHEDIKRSEVYKLVNSKRENVNYRIKTLIEHKILLYSDLSKNNICLSKRLKEHL